MSFFCFSSTNDHYFYIWKINKQLLVFAECSGFVETKWGFKSGMTKYDDDHVLLKIHSFFKTVSKSKNPVQINKM